jgi:hypothetical protein
LFVTVIDIEAKQYARIEIGGLFVIFETGKGSPPALPDPDCEERKGSRPDEGDDRPLKFRISCCSGILMA